jgi:hypothetical protein
MSDELNAAEKIVEEVLIDLMIERVRSEREMPASIQASSTREVQATSSTSRGAGSSRPLVENRTKHRDDLENVKLIQSILPDYIPPLAGVVSRDSVPRDFEYSMVTAYLSKGIRAVHTQQDMITTLKFSDFNLRDRKNYSMLALYKYLIKMKGKNSNIVPQQWRMNLT